MEPLKLDYVTENEMEDICGGWLLPAAVGALIGVALTQDLDDLASSFRAGYNAAG